MNKKRAVFQAFFRTMLLIFVFLPILWGIRTSILFDHNDSSLVPSKISFRTYAEFLRPGSVFWMAFKNSLIVALSTICVMLPIVIMGSYALGRLEFKGKNLGKIFYVYNKFYVQNQSGTAMAASVVLFLIIIISTLIQSKIVRRKRL